MSPERSKVHAHNLVGRENEDQRFGLRLRLPPGDTFSNILGNDWARERWFVSERARDEAIAELRRQHPYYRLGDRPTVQIEKINRAGTGTLTD